MMHKIKGIIALDLDGTLLDSNKKLSHRNLQALIEAADDGWEIVPTTGRFYDGMPQFVRDLPFVRYAITINGAEVCELETNKIIYKAELPWQQAVKIMEWLDEYPVIYDCYMFSSGWMSEGHKNKIDDLVQSEHSQDMLHRLRKPVPDLKEFLMQKEHGVQKVQFFVKDPNVRPEMMKQLNEEFEGIVVSTALPQNVEINQTHANKGEALLALADYLGCEHSNTLAFGDGTNDLPMIRDAGVGIAMANAADSVKEVADWIAPSNDEDGVAAGIYKYCFE